LRHLEKLVFSEQKTSVPLGCCGLEISSDQFILIVFVLNSGKYLIRINQLNLRSIFLKLILFLFSSIMSYERVRYELMLTILTLMRNGKNNSSELVRRVPISRTLLSRAMAPLIIQSIVVERSELGEVFYQLTEKGEQFQEYLDKTFSLLYLKPM